LPVSTGARIQSGALDIDMGYSNGEFQGSEALLVKGDWEV